MMNADFNDVQVDVPAPPPSTPPPPSIASHSCMQPIMVRSAYASSTASTAYHNDVNKMQATLSASSINSDELKQSIEVHNSGEQRLHERYVWEMRTRSPNITPASTVLNSPDLCTDIQYSMHAHGGRQQQMMMHPHHQIRLGRSPVGQFEQHNMLPQGLTSPGSPTEAGKTGAQCLRDGEIVVFDDIDTNWMNKTSSSSNNSNSSNYTSQEGATCVVTHNNEDILKVTKMIGQLPITEYEGSPRRFGNNTQLQQQQQQHEISKCAIAFPKRPPGFPQRVSPQSNARDRQQMQAAAAAVVVAANNERTTAHNKLIGNLIDIDAEDVIERGNHSNIPPPTSALLESNAKTNKTLPTFDYLYEFSETRKVLEEFFRGANTEEEQRYYEFAESDDLGNYSTRYEQENTTGEQPYVGERLARLPQEESYPTNPPPHKQTNHHRCENTYPEHNDIELYIDSNSRSSEDLAADTELETHLRHHSRNFTLSPETTDYDSNCGDLDSLSNDVNCATDYGKLYTSMPVLEDGLSSGHASDTENNVTTVLGNEKKQCDGESNASEKHFTLQQQQQQQQQAEQEEHFKRMQILEQIEYTNKCYNNNCANSLVNEQLSPEVTLISNLVDVETNLERQEQLQHQQQQQQQQQEPLLSCNEFVNSDGDCGNITATTITMTHDASLSELNCEPIYATLKNTKHSPPPPPLPATTHQYGTTTRFKKESTSIEEAMNDIRSALQRAKTQQEKLKCCDDVLSADPATSPIWVPRKLIDAAAPTCEIINQQSSHCAGDEAEEEADTDLETDRLLGQQRLGEDGYFEEKTIWPISSNIADSNEPSPTTSDVTMLTNADTNNSTGKNKPQTFSSATIRQGIGTSLTPITAEQCQIIGTADVSITSPEKLQYSKSPTGSIKSLKDTTNSEKKAKSRNKEGLLEPAVLIEGVLFRARYLGSTQLVCEGQPTKSTRMMQAEEAVSRIKAPEGESQPSTEVDLFISTEKIMVLNTDLKEIMMDHALRTISYIADIGDLVVLMARRRFMPSDTAMHVDNTDSGILSHNNNSNTTSNSTTITTCGANNKINRTPKMICHVFESDEAQFIAQSIGQAFQVAYMEFLKANGIEDHSFVKEMDYQEVLNSQEIFGDELEIFAKKELQKEVVVPKAKGEILGVVIVESGWGSMLPTVVIANLMSTGAAARCGQLNIGDQLIAINGMSLVGLPLSTCQSYIRNAKNQTAVKFTVVPCAPVVEVKIKRPNTKYQLGFSVQNGVICSLLRGGIAERGGVRVGHRIIEINNQSVVAVPHEKIVNLLATSVGEILMKTMPTSMFRLLTGQENPIYI